MSRSRSCTSLGESSMRLIWQNALAQYKEETGVDLKNELSARFHEFPESDSDEELAEFTDRLVSHSEVSAGWRKTQSTLNSTLKLILLFNNGISELAATVGIPGGKAIFLAVGISFEASEVSKICPG
ncbi:hypothetical protein R3P38DRAFT_68216 [Favolaschia claudopus]|uniref:Fungal STAND N-terminal Goodbye domain-containing protein n=1 Tax=Favolaschia claudopus TaxID=2862362 RepID=A0AAW0D1B1_9AGAR